MKELKNYKIFQENHWLWFKSIMSWKAVPEWLIS